MRALRVCLILSVVVPAAEWPQWGGPGRNFLLPADTKVPRWPPEGPVELWSRNLGEGYSSMALSGGVLYTMHRRDSKDVVVALEPATGKTVWETALDAPHDPRMNIEAGPGPHSTPLIKGDRIFVTTVLAQLVALDRKTGKVVWSRDLWKEHKGTFLERGYASSPLAYKDAIIVPVGGAGRALIAFRQSDGSVLWSQGDAENSYSSPILIRAAGRDHIVSFMAKEVIGADAGTGKTLWSFAHRTMYDINASTPVWCAGESVLVVSSGYDGGVRGIHVTERPRELWNHKRLRVHHTNMACSDGVVYGSSGDFGPAPFTALEAKTGKVLWQDRAFSKASFIFAAGTIFVVDDDGSVAMATVGRNGLKVLGEAQLLRANAWTVPMLEGSHLFVRDRHRLAALQLNEP